MGMRADPSLLSLVVSRVTNVKMHSLKSRGSSELMLDVLFAAAVPMIIGGVAREWGRLHPRIFGFFAHWVRWGWSPKFVRTIEYEKHVLPGFGGEDDGTDEGQRNNLLHRAILLYMGQELDIRYSKAQVLLSAVKEKGTLDKNGDPYIASHRKKKVYGGTSEQLKAYSVNVTPPKRDWVCLSDGVFFLQQTTSESDEPGNGGHRGVVKKTVTFTFASNKSDGDLRIQAFMNKAFLWYCKAMESTEDHFRYYYTPLTEGPGRPRVTQLPEPGERERAMDFMSMGRGRGASPPGPKGVQRYKRYRLGNEKGFDTLFFPEKELLLKILHNFQHKTGKYGIKGYPHKLGLLLHGPPGTGKSSLIKALALHTERHVIDVPLARIKTNQDLMDIMFDQSFPVDKQDLPVTLAVENVIFVMEDVDATSPVVRSRDLPGRTGTPAQPQSTQTSARKAPLRKQAGTANRAAIAAEAAAAAVEATGKQESPAVGTEIAVSVATDITPASLSGLTATPTSLSTVSQGDGTAAAAQSLAVVDVGGVPGSPRAGVAEVAGTKNEDVGDGEAKGGIDSDDGEGSETMGRSMGVQPGNALEVALLKLTGEAAAKKKEDEQKEKEYSSMTDKLDLAGLLNVLDGVVDSPGRIVIMTTNFPDALDAALIRPGRVDKKIHLGYMKYDAAKEMTRHFFEVDHLTADQEQRLRIIFGDCVDGGGGGETGGGEGRKITPAVVEQLAGEFDTVDEFIVALEAI